MGKIIDMTGWIMSEHGVPDSRIKVICKVGKDNQNQTLWLCECLCQEHNQFIANGANIRRGNTKSCGCLVRERLINYNKNIHKKTNKYDLSGEYGIGWTSNTNKEFYFDLEDFNKIKDYCWYEDITKTGYHSLRTRDAESKKTILMTSLLECKYYDHINRNPLDNRKNNLRKCTHRENARNVTLQKNSSSGVIGVGWVNTHSKWHSYIKTEEKQLSLGYFFNKDDAIKARLKAEAKYYGEFAPQQHLFKQYGITIQNELEDIDELQVI